MKFFLRAGFLISMVTGIIGTRRSSTTVRGWARALPWITWILSVTFEIISYQQQRQAQEQEQARNDF